MKRPDRIVIIKLVIGTMWFLAMMGAIIWFQQSGFDLRHLPRELRLVVRHFGAWGPLFMVFLYVARTFIFLPSSILHVVAGTLYGPVLGSVINVLGENISAGIAFGLGRLFGRHFIHSHEHGWVRQYDELLSREGFVAVLVMRLLFFPFDVVNFGSGMSSILYRQYALATFLGLIPSSVTFSVLGNVFESGRSMVVFFVFLILTLTGTYLLSRSKWVRSKLLRKHTDEHATEF